MQVILFEKMVEKFPVYDPNWTDEVQAKWMELYVELFRWGVPLDCRRSDHSAIKRVFLLNWFGRDTGGIVQTIRFSTEVDRQWSDR